MATYQELASISEESGFDGFIAKVRVAVVDKAVTILGQAVPTAAEVEWAKKAITYPAVVADELVWYVVVANKSVNLATIVAASDSAVQNNVNAAVDKITGV